MPLEPKLNGRFWYAVGRVEYNGKPITGYLRISTRSSKEAGAKDWIAAYEAREIRRHIIGDEADELMMAEAITLYDKPSEASKLIKIVEALGDDILHKKVNSITGKFLRDLGYKLMPLAATDTMWREVVTPLRSVINNAHDLGRCAPIKVKRYSEKERVDQDEMRGKQSRVERSPADREWMDAFCEHADIYNAAMAHFMFETAARIDQAVSLEPDDIDLMNKRVWIKAQKGHPAQWVSISHEMMIELANLPPKRPKNRKTGEVLSERTFGYGSPTGYTKRWRRICRDAGIPYISAHPAGRHGYFTHLTVREGMHVVDAAKAGRWSDPSLPLRVYAHAQTSEPEIRELMRKDHVKALPDTTINPLKKRTN